MILIIRLSLFLFLKYTIVRSKKSNISINVFCYENDLAYPVHISKQKLKNYIDLLLINDKNKSHRLYKRF